MINVECEIDHHFCNIQICFGYTFMFNIMIIVLMLNYYLKFIQTFQSMLLN